MFILVIDQPEGYNLSIYSSLIMGPTFRVPRWVGLWFWNVGRTNSCHIVDKRHKIFDNWLNWTEPINQPEL